jgi:8-oxo-dGTP pyrophosphatase MutT (NUDIX family)
MLEQPFKEQPIKNLSPDSKLVRVTRNEKGWEKAERPPGTRIIVIKSDGSVLLTREERHEHGGQIDYRIPGGKVVDSLKEYDDLLRLGTLDQAIIDGAKREALEETGLQDMELTQVAQWNAGATVDWKLHFFIVNGDNAVFTSPTSQGEVLSKEWVTPNRLKDLVRQGEFREYQSLGVLLQLLIQKGYL